MRASSCARGLSYHSLRLLLRLRSAEVFAGKFLSKRFVASSQSDARLTSWRLARHQYFYRTR